MHSVSILKEFYNFLVAKYGINEAPVWSVESQRWVALHPLTVTKVLRSPEFSVVKHHEEIEKIQSEDGLSLKDIVSAAKMMPLSHDGDEHRELKLLSSHIIQSVTAPALENFKEISRTLLSNLLVRGRRFDLISEFVHPISARMFSTMAGLDEKEFLSQTPSGRCASQLLTSAKRRLSGARWLSINETMRHRQSSVQGSPLEKVIRGSFSLITFEIFKSAIANSLIGIVKSHEGQSLNRMPFSEQLPFTSIPFVDRVCNTDVTVCGRSIKKGESVLLYLGGCMPQSHGEQKLFFGTGPHICIGKSITNAAWSALSSFLQDREELIFISDVVFRDLDLVLISPTRANVEVK